MAGNLNPIGTVLASVKFQESKHNLTSLSSKRIAKSASLAQRRDLAIPGELKFPNFLKWCIDKIYIT
jgi:hypothetical protein